MFGSRLPQSNHGEPLLSSAARTTGSLLTFADMVLALDHKSRSEASAKDKEPLGSARPDHTYAHKEDLLNKNGFENVQRSRRSKTFLEDLGIPQVQAQQIKDEKELDNISSHQMQTRQGTAELKPCACNCFNEPPVSRQSKQQSTSVKKQIPSGLKRSSSVENIQCRPEDSKSSSSEWPLPLEIDMSPRKSSSLEKIVKDHEYFMKKKSSKSKSTENIQKPSVPESLHRVVKDNLEFPYWPRKADHTYATATWDGTAASHGLFEHDLRTVDSNQQVILIPIVQVQGMDYTEVESNSNLTDEQKLDNALSICPQRKDHTYVKAKSLSSNEFSSATFPRQKTRDDHTYFHNKINGSSSGGKEWTSEQSVMDCSEQDSSQLSETFENLQTFSKRSAKKDHNYSTSV